MCLWSRSGGRFVRTKISIQQSCYTPCLRASTSGWDMIFSPHARSRREYAYPLVFVECRSGEYFAPQSRASAASLETVEHRDEQILYSLSHSCICVILYRFILRSLTTLFRNAHNSGIVNSRTAYVTQEFRTVNVTAESEES